MNKNIEYDLGPQPIAKIMAEHGLKPSDLVGNSTEQLTYKMVNRAVKGRRLTPNTQHKILNALNGAPSGLKPEVPWAECQSGQSLSAP